jgi:signal peptidase I
VSKKQKKGPAEFKAEPKTPPKRKRSLLMEWVVSLGGALAIALSLKLFIADIYSIPTGSMEPVLFGSEAGGDRVFCTKVNYALRESKGPRRWEVMVFTFPTEDRSNPYYDMNFIKRCVGLPGEIVSIIDGDLYTRPLSPQGFSASFTQPPQLQTKPAPLQDSLWIPVYRDDFAATTPEALAYHWDQLGEGWNIGLRFRPMSAGVKQNGVLDRHIKRQVVTFLCPKEREGNPCGGSLRKTVESVQLTGVCPRCGAFLNETHLVNTQEHRCAGCGKERLQEVRDPSVDESSWCEQCERRLPPETVVKRNWNFPYPGVPGAPDQRGGRQIPDFTMVKDLRLSLGVAARSAGGELHLSLLRNQVRFRLRLPLGRAESAVLEREGRPVAKSKAPVALPKGNTVQVSYFRADGDLVLQLDGVEVLRHSLKQPYYDLMPHPTVSSGVELSLVGGAVDLQSVALSRDLQYVASGPMEGRYDNVQRLQLPLEALRRRGSYVVPEGNYLAFGDNQPTSHDSRAWGPVPDENLIGPAHLVWWPLHRMRILK